MPVLLSYRNQSVDLLCKSIDWFLYEGNTGTSWVKIKNTLQILHQIIYPQHLSFPQQNRFFKIQKKDKKSRNWWDNKNYSTDL